MEKMNFCTVKELKKALETLNDDMFLMCQVVSKDGKAWNMWGSAYKLNDRMGVIMFEHDELLTLPDSAFEEKS